MKLTHRWHWWTRTGRWLPVLGFCCFQIIVLLSSASSKINNSVVSFLGTCGGRVLRWLGWGNEAAFGGTPLVSTHGQRVVSTRLMLAYSHNVRMTKSCLSFQFLCSKVVSTHLWNTPLNLYQQAIVVVCCNFLGFAHSRLFSRRRLLEVWWPRATWKAKNSVKEVGWSSFHTLKKLWSKPW